MSFFGMFNNTTVIKNEVESINEVESDYDHISIASISSDISSSNIGENGTKQLDIDEVGDIRLIFFSHLCRGAPDEKLNTLFEKYYADINEENKVEMICDLFVLMFEKRDCRGGEGEKKLFFDMFTRIDAKYPLITHAIMHLIPEYGSWKDLWTLTNHVSLDKTAEIYKISSTQIIQDVQMLKDNKVENISLCAKWSPSEKSEVYRRLYPSIKTYLCQINPTSKKFEKDYRQTINLLREKTNVPEQLMCSGRYGDIDPSKVPSICANKNRKSFLNISLDEEKEMNYEIGNRFPENADRIKSRKNWLSAIKDKKIKGGQLDPPTLVESSLSTKDFDELAFINCQWDDLIKKTRGQIDKAVKDGYVPMTNIIPIIDMSPSMAGSPMLAAIGLGIMLSELCDPTYGNVVISFDSESTIVPLNPRLPFTDRVKIIQDIPMGYSTNFQLAMTRLCEIIEKYKLNQDNLPALCILTDEQMDHANQFGYSTTVDEQIKDMFATLGNKMHGIPFTRPRTVHWNLRADTDGYPVKSCENNVQAITGYSASLLDLILTGKPEPSPYDTMRRKLDSTRYDAVRSIILPILEKN
jgi:hypothetical protein